MEQKAVLDVTKSKIKKVTYYNVCPQCGKATETVVDVPDYAWDFICGGNTGHLCDECHEQKQAEERQKIEELRKHTLIQNSCVPENFWNWDKTKGNATLVKAIYEQKEHHLYICGGYNTCKTRAAACNLLIMAKRGNRCRFIRFSEMAGEYARICKIDSAAAKSYVNDLLRNNILLIDDLGKRRITETAGELLYDIFDRAYAGDCNAKIWVTTNLNLSTLIGLFENADMGDAVASRIDRMITHGSMAKIVA